MEHDLNKSEITCDIWQHYGFLKAIIYTRCDFSVFDRSVFAVTVQKVDFDIECCLEFTRNGAKNKNRPPGGHSALIQGTLLMNEVREQWPDGFELTGRLC